MFGWFSSENDAIGLLKKDHDKVKELFDEFDKAGNKPAKKKIVEQALTELKIHAVLEEELFYPAIRKHVGVHLMNEADEEHHVAKVLIAELDHTQDANDHFDAKFVVLAENVRHHIKEEENAVMPKAREMDIDFERLGQEMLNRKQELLERGVPAAAEEKMVAFAHGKADSPAKAAHKTARNGSRSKTARATTRKTTATAKK